jgi:pimeloyl-ACP methyl ester carboxylesterase
MYLRPLPFIKLSTPTILIGYSSGTESALMYARMRLESGGKVQSIVLLGATFDGSDKDGRLYLGTVGGDFDDWASYMDYALSKGTDVLVVDDWPFGDTNAANIGLGENTSGTYAYKYALAPHYSGYPVGSNNDPVLKWSVYKWIHANAKR